MMIEHAESLKLNFKIKDMIGETAFQIAKNYGKLDIVDLIKKKLKARSITEIRVLQSGSNGFCPILNFTISRSNADTMAYYKRSLKREMTH